MTKNNKHPPLMIEGRFPTTELGVDIKFLTLEKGVMDIGEKWPGYIIRKEYDKFIFIQAEEACSNETETASE